VAPFLFYCFADKACTAFKAYHLNILHICIHLNCGIQVKHPHSIRELNKRTLFKIQILNRIFPLNLLLIEEKELKRRAHRINNLDKE
jgi:hypothetical protein